MRRLAALLAVATTVGLGVALAAWAEPPPGTLGTVALEPATGLDTTTPVARTSAGCSTESDAYFAKVYGPGGFQPGLMATFGLQDVGFSSTAGFPVQFANSMADIATDNQTTVVAGTYTVEVSCVESFSQVTKGTFTTKMYFTDAHHYQSTPPGGGTTTTTTTTTTSSSSTTTTTTQPPTSTETTVTSTPANAETVSVTVGGQQKLAHTGSPVETMVLMGIAMVILGAYALYTTRGRKVYTPTPWPRD